MNNQMLGKVHNITAVSNERIKNIKTLRRKKNRNETKCFIAEGKKIIQDAMEKNWKIRTFVCLKDDEAVQELAAKTRQKGSDVLFVNKNILSKITNRDNAANCVAVIEQKDNDINEINPKIKEIWIALDRVRDTGNLGTIIRTCQAMGIEGIIMVGECADVFNMETIRASMGALFHTKIYKIDENQFIGLMKKWKNEWKGHIIATHLDANKNYRDAKYSKTPCMVIMGNEQQGLSDVIAENADEKIKIDMKPNADSLNLAVATGIVIAETQR